MPCTADQPADNYFCNGDCLCPTNVPYKKYAIRNTGTMGKMSFCLVPELCAKADVFVLPDTNTMNAILGSEKLVRPD
jgi:hypothetical protein